MVCRCQWVFPEACTTLLPRHIFPIIAQFFFLWNIYFRSMTGELMHKLNSNVFNCPVVNSGAVLYSSFSQWQNLRPNVLTLHLPSPLHLCAFEAGRISEASVKCGVKVRPFKNSRHLL